MAWLDLGRGILEEFAAYGTGVEYDLSRHKTRPLGVSDPSRPTGKNCPTCGTAVAFRRGVPATYCAVSCRDLAAQRRRRASRRPTAVVKACLECRTPVAASNTKPRVYCSRRCCLRASRRRRAGVAA